MSYYKRKENNTADTIGKGRITARLREAGISTDRFVPLRPGTKTPACKWRGDGLGHNPEDVGRDHAIKCGDGLLVVDVDHPEKLSVDLPPTFTVKSPHGSSDRAHHYYRVNEEVSSVSREWGEIQSEATIIIGPGTVLDHDAYCKDDCPLSGTGTYQNALDRQIATLDESKIQELRDDGTDADSSTGTREVQNLSIQQEVDEDIVARGEANIRDFQANCSGLAFDDLMDILNGGTGSIEGLREGGEIDRSAADVEACWMLYGIMRFSQEPSDQAAKLTSEVYTHYCIENHYTKDGQPRKWLRDEDYRRHQLNAAIVHFEFNDWHRWRRRKHADGLDHENYENWTGDYGDITYDVGQAALDILCGVFKPDEATMFYGLDLSSIQPTQGDKILTQSSCAESPRADEGNHQVYPTKDEVVELMQTIDPDREASTHESVLKSLQQDGLVKAARMGQTKWVYYPSSFPDPPDACYVRVGGERQDPTVPSPDSQTVE